MNELDLIRWIRARAGASPNVPVGIGDDCAALRVPPGKLLLVTTDMVIAGVHFDPRTASAAQVGHKTMARGLSDIAAMAGDALAAVVALAAPRGTDSKYLQELFLGMKSVADAFGVPIIGGDVASSTAAGEAGNLPLTLTVTALGAGDETALALRSGARPGDRALVTGELGGSILGRHLSFLPRLKEAKWLRDKIAIHAMIDLSDGLAADAGHIAEESGVAIELWEEAIPISRAAGELARTSRRTPLEHALNDGEDYELFFTADADEAEALLRQPEMPVRVTCIGQVNAGSGLWLGRGAARRPLAAKGWVHEF
jgi:thiamine-monophosphate kinase